MKAPAWNGRPLDLNTLLAGINLLVMGLNLSMLGRLHGSLYVNENTILLGGLLALQTHAALFVERRRRDPFALLLAFTMIFYFALRIYTLALFQKSSVFERFPYDASDTNFGLEFVILANTALYAGLLAVHASAARRVDGDGWRAKSPGGVTLLLLASIAFAYSNDRFWTSSNVPRALNFLMLFVAQNIVVLMAFAYLLLFRKSIGRSFVIAVGGLILLEALLHLLYGSRSAITGLIQNYLLVTLAIAGTMKIARRYVIIGVMAFPVLLVLLVGSFAVSTFLRVSREQGSTFDPTQAVQMAREAGKQMSTGSSVDVLLPPVFERVGYLDFSAELIANRTHYTSLINVPTYAKSIIDNQLTPGFDLFDQPKISNALRFVYEGLGTPSKRMIGDQYTYQSDQLGLYGELYVLFGLGSLPLFFLFAYTAKRIYVRLRPTNPFSLTMKRLVVLTVFLTTINSYGIDWVIIDTVPLVVAIMIYSFVFATVPQGSERRVRIGGPALSGMQ